jgi:hypothetical protein
MQRTDFDFDVISGPSAPPLPPRPTERQPAGTAGTGPGDRPLDPAAHRPESPTP